MRTKLSPFARVIVSRYRSARRRPARHRRSRREFAVGATSAATAVGEPDCACGCWWPPSAVLPSSASSPSHSSPVSRCSGRSPCVTSSTSRGESSGRGVPGTRLGGSSAGSSRLPDAGGRPTCCERGRPSSSRLGTVSVSTLRPSGRRGSYDPAPSSRLPVQCAWISRTSMCTEPFVASRLVG